MVGPCPCGHFHPHTHCATASSSFSLLWPAAAAAHYYSDDPYSSPAAPVDCTLSLGNPSTRRTKASSSRDNAAPPSDRRTSAGGSCISNFCWDFLQPKHSNASSKSGRTTAAGDPLVARRCANCDTTSTPLWRNGPRGPKSLCNACGIRFKKEERRMTAAAASNGGGMVDGGYHHGQKMQYFSPELRFMDDVESRDSDSGIQFLSWRLNVTERPTSLVPDFTR